jgi:hypothetical protein
MGWGILFIGYFIAYLGAFLPQISLFTYVLGSGVILFSLRKLIYENKLFVSSAIVAIVLELLSIISLGINVLNGGRGTLSVVLVYIVEALAYAFNILVMLSISKLAKDAGYTRLLTVNLANDELGYIVPPSDFIVHPTNPYFQRYEVNGEDHYEETNSVGKLCAEKIAEAFASALEKLG